MCFFYCAFYGAGTHTCVSKIPNLKLCIGAHPIKSISKKYCLFFLIARAATHFTIFYIIYNECFLYFNTKYYRKPRITKNGGGIMATKSSTNSNARTRASATKSCGGRCGGNKNRTNKMVESGTEMCSGTRANSTSTRAKSNTKSSGTRASTRNSRAK